MSDIAHGRRVLLVEDDPDIREAIAILLEDEGYEVAITTNGAEALELLRKDRQFCIILLDLWMPVMNGFVFRTLQQQDPDLARIPVVVISADPTVKQKANEMRATAYFKKPARLHDIVNVLNQYC